MKTQKAIDQLVIYRQTAGSGDLSAWSRSGAKRVFDFVAIVVFAPILAPLLTGLALAVFVTSGAPIVFRQIRAGKNGTPFIILKFRTMKPGNHALQSAIAIESSDRITRFGSVLRRTKLDELLQVFNILAGDMSLVGPRPKVPEQQLAPLDCRPGLTGPATLSFAREETLLAQIPVGNRLSFYYETIIPAKLKLDSDYMKRATMASDFSILLRTVLGRWGGNDTKPESARFGNGFEETPKEASAS